MFCTLWHTHTHTRGFIPYRENFKVEVYKLDLGSYQILGRRSSLSQSVSRFGPTVCAITAPQLHKAPNFPNPSLQRVHPITRMSLSFKVGLHMRRSQVDCPVTHCLQMCSNMISTITDIFLFLFVEFQPPHPPIPAMHTACTHGSCTHSPSCLYMQGYFQTEPVKDIQPAVNTGI